MFTFHVRIWIQHSTFNDYSKKKFFGIEEQEKCRLNSKKKKKNFHTSFHIIFNRWYNTEENKDKNAAASKRTKKKKKKNYFVNNTLMVASCSSVKYAIFISRSWNGATHKRTYEYTLNVVCRFVICNRSFWFYFCPYLFFAFNDPQPRISIKSNSLNLIEQNMPLNQHRIDKTFFFPLQTHKEYRNWASSKFLWI